MSDIDLAVTGGLVYTCGDLRRCTLGVTDGRISHVVDPEVTLDADRTLDAEGNLVLPGCVDAHVHVRAGDEREGVASATAAAAAGGVTTVFDMPNYPPTATTPEHWNDIATLYENEAHVDYSIFGHVNEESVGTGAVEQLSDTGTIAYKIFMSVDGSANPWVIRDKGDLYTAFEEIAGTGRPVWVHAEDDEYHAAFIERAEERGLTGFDAFFESSPPIVETTAVSDLIDLAEETGVTTVVAHTSTAEALDRIARANADGIPIFAETTPYYLAFDEDRIRDIGSAGTVMPPVRDPENRQGLWDRLENRVDTLGTDHAPQFLEDKDHPPDEASPGAPQLETALPYMLTTVNDDCTTIETVVELYAENPAKMLGLYPRKGTLQVGTDADIIIVDMDAEWTVDPEAFESRAKYSPFDGWTFSAQIERTFVRGHEVARDMQATDETPGELLSGDDR